MEGAVVEHLKRTAGCIPEDAFAPLFHGTIESLTDISGVIAVEINNQLVKAIFFKKSVHIDRVKVRAGVSLLQVLNVGIPVMLKLEQHEGNFKASLVKVDGCFSSTPNVRKVSSTKHIAFGTGTVAEIVSPITARLWFEYEGQQEALFELSNLFLNGQRSDPTREIWEYISKGDTCFFNATKMKESCKYVATCVWQGIMPSLSTIVEPYQAQAREAHELPAGSLLLGTVVQLVPPSVAVVTIYPCGAVLLFVSALTLDKDGVPLTQEDWIQDHLCVDDIVRFKLSAKNVIKHNFRVVQSAWKFVDRNKMMKRVPAHTSSNKSNPSCINASQSLNLNTLAINVQEQNVEKLTSTSSTRELAPLIIPSPSLASLGVPNIQHASPDLETSPQESSDLRGEIFHGTVQSLQEKSGTIAFHINNKEMKATFFRNRVLINKAKVAASTSLLAVLQYGMPVSLMVTRYKGHKNFLATCVEVELLRKTESVVSENGSDTPTTILPSNLLNCTIGGLTGKIKCYTSSLTGILECSFHGIKMEASFTRDFVISNNEENVSLKELLPIGKVIYFDGMVKELQGLPKLRILCMWHGTKKILLNEQPVKINLMLQNGQEYTGIVCEVRSPLAFVAAVGNVPVFVDSTYYSREPQKMKALTRSIGFGDTVVMVVERWYRKNAEFDWVGIDVWRENDGGISGPAKQQDEMKCNLEGRLKAAEENGGMLVDSSHGGTIFQHSDAFLLGLPLASMGTTQILTPGVIAPPANNMASVQSGVGEYPKAGDDWHENLADVRDQVFHGTIMQLKKHVGTIRFQIGNTMKIATFCKDKLCVNNSQVEKHTSLKTVLEVGMPVLLTVDRLTGEKDYHFRATSVQVALGHDTRHSMGKDTSSQGSSDSNGEIFYGTIKSLDENCGTIAFNINDKEEKALFYKKLVRVNNAAVPQDASLSQVLALNMPVSFRVNRYTGSKNFIATLVEVLEEPSPALLHTPASMVPSSSPVLHLTGEIKCHTSSSTGIVECSIRGTKMKAYFTRDFLITNNVETVSLQELLPIGEIIHLDGVIREFRGQPRLRVICMWQHGSRKKFSIKQLDKINSTLINGREYTGTVYEIRPPRAFVAAVGNIPVFVFSSEPSNIQNHTLSISHGDTVTMVVERRYGKNAEFDWVSKDTWRQNGGRISGPANLRDEDLVSRGMSHPTKLRDEDQYSTDGSLVSAGTLGPAKLRNNQCSTDGRLMSWGISCPTKQGDEDQCRTDGSLVSGGILGPAKLQGDQYSTDESVIFREFSHPSELRIEHLCSTDGSSVSGGISHPTKLRDEDQCSTGGRRISRQVRPHLAKVKRKRRVAGNVIIRGNKGLARLQDEEKCSTAGILVAKGISDSDPAELQDEEKHSLEGRLVAVEESSGVLAGSNGGTVGFQHTDAFLLGVPLTGVDLTQVLTKGDTFSYTLPTCSETAQVWFGAKNFEDCTQQFRAIDAYCKTRCIHQAVYITLTSRLGNQRVETIEDSTQPSGSASDIDDPSCNAIVFRGFHSRAWPNNSGSQKLQVLGKNTAENLPGPSVELMAALSPGKQLDNETALINALRQQLDQSTCPLLAEGVKQTLRHSLLSILHQRCHEETYSEWVAGKTLAIIENGVKDFVTGYLLEKALQSVEVPVPEAANGTDAGNIQTRGTMQGIKTSTVESTIALPSVPVQGAIIDDTDAGNIQTRGTMQSIKTSIVETTGALPSVPVSGDVNYIVTGNIQSRGTVQGINISTIESTIALPSVPVSGDINDTVAGNIESSEAVQGIMASAVESTGAIPSVPVPGDINDTVAGNIQSCGTMQSIKVNAVQNTVTLLSVPVPGAIDGIVASNIQSCGTVQGIKVSAIESIEALPSVPVPGDINDIDAANIQSCGTLQGIKMSAIESTEALPSVPVPGDINDIDAANIQSCGTVQGIKVSAIESTGALPSIPVPGNIAGTVTSNIQSHGTVQGIKVSQVKSTRVLLSVPVPGAIDGTVADNIRSRETGQGIKQGIEASAVERTACDQFVRVPKDINPLTTMLGSTVQRWRSGFSFIKSKFNENPRI